ncbi:hypothetical protein RM549_13715 [Salegentibacter sp. F188]|uniref:Uncharacterized protein n=1 Tax=Autumnicola patrickiae TaxID=3075591 RepID=A0ABU3E4L0_9FLAO|nr:hypothetical protein [Salegentibacter sp. F188]MDT0690850.1 hypothetical protein [Salegentibacter sp. F188]
MKIFIYSVIILAVILIGYHVSILDFENLLQGESAKAAAAILASICVILLMAILLVSRKISGKHS